MATMNVSLPEQMKDWVESQSASGRYSNASDYVRDLIRKDQVRAELIIHFQKAVEQGLASGTLDYSREATMERLKGLVRRGDAAA